RLVRCQSRARVPGASQDAARPSRALRRHLSARPPPRRPAGVRGRVSAERRDRVDDRRPRRGVAAIARTGRLAQSVAEAFKSTGGAQIGWISASWPLAQLAVMPRSLVIRTWLLGTY